MSPPAAGLKLLIVDDHAPMRQTLRALLSHLAREIREAADGTQAIATFSELQPDWVVMDFQMKPVNGLEAAREIRRRHPAARIVIVSQYDDADLRTEADLAGARACFGKENLGAVVQLLAQSSDARNGLAAHHGLTPCTQTSCQPCL